MLSHSSPIEEGERAPLLLHSPVPPVWNGRPCYPSKPRKLNSERLLPTQPTHHMMSCFEVLPGGSLLAGSGVVRGIPRVMRCSTIPIARLMNTHDDSPSDRQDTFQHNRRGRKQESCAKPQPCGGFDAFSVAPRQMLPFGIMLPAAPKQRSWTFSCCCQAAAAHVLRKVFPWLPLLVKCGSACSVSPNVKGVRLLPVSRPHQNLSGQ